MPEGAVEEGDGGFAEGGLQGGGEFGDVGGDEETWAVLGFGELEGEAVGSVISGGRLAMARERRG